MRLSLLLLLPALLLSQPPAPTIRVTTRLVSVNVVVRSKGQPVTDLTARDFELFDRGKPQKISFFSMSSATPLHQTAAKTPKNVFTNRGEAKSEAPTTATVLLVDGLNTEFSDQTFARDQIVRFLGQIDPSERIAIYALGRKLHVLHDFTDDREHLARVLARFRGGRVSEVITPDLDSQVSQMLDPLQLEDKAQKNEADFRDGLRAERTLAALDSIANHFARLPGRKNLVWVSGSFPIYPGYKVITGLFETSRERSFTAQAARTARLFSDANMAIYPVDARGIFSVGKYGAEAARSTRLMRVEDRPNPFHADNFDVMKLLADGTGGVAFHDTNDLSKAIRRAVEDAQVTYTLGFYPAEETLDGKFHELNVKVARKGFDARYRKGYFAHKDDSPSADERKALLRDALWTPLQASAIEVVARTDFHDGAIDLSLAINPETFTLEQKQARWVGGLDVYLAQCDVQGKELETTRDSIDLNLTTGRYASRRENWLALAKALHPRPEAVQLRIIVQDKLTGALGSVHIPLSKLKK
jgi:VWFA-related protein